MSSFAVSPNAPLKSVINSFFEEARTILTESSLSFLEIYWISSGIYFKYLSSKIWSICSVLAYMMHIGDYDDLLEVCNQ